jgi:hypothetical protein
MTTGRLSGRCSRRRSIVIPREVRRRRGPRAGSAGGRRGTVVSEPAPGDLVTYGGPVDHIAFWLGGGRILHATGCEGGLGEVEEEEPESLRLRRNRVVRL